MAVARRLSLIHIFKDGFESGATWSWLQSSEAGYTLYERLGFRTVARWPCWLHPATNP